MSSDPSHSMPSTHARADILPLSSPHSKSSEPRFSRPVVIRPALTAAAADVLEAAYLLGTPANIGYMSGALKHFFDGIYYPCLEATRRRPYGLYVHGGMDTTGAVRAVESITTGLQWRAVRPAVSVTGPPGKQDLEACWELGALLAAEVAEPLGRQGWVRTVPGSSPSRESQSRSRLVCVGCTFAVTALDVYQPMVLDDSQIDYAGGWHV